MFQELVQEMKWEQVKVEKIRELFFPEMFQELVQEMKGGNKFKRILEHRKNKIEVCKKDIVSSLFLLL